MVKRKVRRNSFQSCRLTEDLARIEPTFLQRENLESVVILFVRAKADFLPHLLAPFQKMTALSRGVCRLLSTHCAFLKNLLDRLTYPRQTAMIHVQLLKILTSLYLAAANPRSLNLPCTRALQTMIQNTSSTSVRESANRLLKAVQMDS